MAGNAFYNRNNAKKNYCFALNASFRAVITVASGMCVVQEAYHRTTYHNEAAEFLLMD